MDVGLALHMPLPAQDSGMPSLQLHALRHLEHSQHSFQHGALPSVTSFAPIARAWHLVNLLLLPKE